MKKLGYIIIGIAIFFAVKWLVPPYGKEAAIDVTQHEAKQLNVPTGLFGAKWLISMAEAKKILPNAVQVPASTSTDTMLTENREFYSRNAKIDYVFSNDYLVMFIVTFQGESSKDDFLTTQAYLVKDYGSMPEPTPTKLSQYSSEKIVDRFAIQHWILDANSIEQILFYRTEG